MTRVLPILTAIVVVLQGVAAAQENPAVAAAEVDAFLTRLDKIRQKQKVWEQEIEKELKDAEAAKIARVMDQARPRRLAYLRLVMMLEEDLRLLASPADEVDRTIDPPELGEAEKRRVQELRQKIREAERKRIRSDLKGEGRGTTLERLQEKINKDEQSLDAIFGRNTAKLLREIERVRKALAREKESRLPSDSKINELEEQEKRVRADVEKIRHYVYGIGPGAGFEAKAGESEAAHGKLLAEVVAERDKVLKVLRGGNEKGGEDGVKRGVVGGSYLISANLGVVLDVSGSMAPHIEKLKEEIAKTFSGPRFREVSGCSIQSPSLRELEQSGVVAAKGKADTVGVIEELCVVYGVDTIYWFCDLRDAVLPTGVRRLRSILQRSGASFYVKSVDRRPDRSLQPLITEFQR